MIRKVLLFLGMVSLLLGPSAAFSSAKIDASPAIFMDGPLMHAMNHETCCPDLDEDSGNADCNIAACSMGGCSISFLSETPPAKGDKISLANAPGAPPFLTGLSSHNLPLPPP